MNNIPQEKNVYNNTPIDFAKADNKLAAAQLDIGESSNVAQIGLSYTYNEFGHDYHEYVALLSVYAQLSIDSAKKCYDVDIHAEIQRLKQEMNIKSIGYPAFFAGIRPDLRKKVNPNIVCPMNCVYKMKNKMVTVPDVIPNSEFFVQHRNYTNYRKSKQVEKLIEDYSLELFRYRMDDNTDTDDYFLLRSDYEDLIESLRRVTLSKNYVGLMSWLINRALIVTPNMQSHRGLVSTKLGKNRPLLLKVLYDMSPKNFKKCLKSGGEVGVF